MNSGQERLLAYQGISQMINKLFAQGEAQTDTKQER